MAKSSSKPKTFKRTLAGIIFWPKKKPEGLHISVKAWVDAGKPDDATIYDSLDNLLGCNIPICDGISYRGVFQRLPKTRPHQECDVVISDIIVVPAKPPEVAKTIKGISAADTKDHHKLNY